MQRWAQHPLVGTEWGCHLHNTETGPPPLSFVSVQTQTPLKMLGWWKEIVSPVCVHSYLLSHLLFCLPEIHRSGISDGSSRAGNDNYKSKCRLSAPISSGQDQQRPPKWFKVTWVGSIVYLIKKWPIQPRSTCLVLFVAWLPAKASLNRPCVSYCGSRHLSIDFVSSCRLFFRFGWFWFLLFLFYSFFPFSSPPPPAITSRRTGVNSIGMFMSWLKNPKSKSLSGICDWKFGFLVRVLPYLSKSKPALEITSDYQSFLLSLVQTDCGF